MWIAGLSFIAVQYLEVGGMIFLTMSLSFIVWKLLIDDFFYLCVLWVEWTFVTYVSVDSHGYYYKLKLVLVRLLLLKHFWTSYTGRHCDYICCDDCAELSCSCARIIQLITWCDTQQWLFYINSNASICFLFCCCVWLSFFRWLHQLGSDSRFLVWPAGRRREVNFNISFLSWHQRHLVPSPFHTGAR